jgi:dUTP pyrophosphatase
MDTTKLPKLIKLINHIKMKVKVINKSDNLLPAYATKQSAGMDLLSNKDCYLAPMERAIIPTGLFLEIPDGYEGQVRPRSGFAIKSGVTVLNSPGTVDADYRGEVGVILINLSDKVVEINKGDRIAQMVFAKVEQAEWQPELFLSDTDRGAGGFGSTGKQ